MLDLILSLQARDVHCMVLKPTKGEQCDITVSCPIGMALQELLSLFHTITVYWKNDESHFWQSHTWTKSWQMNFRICYPLFSETETFLLTLAEVVTDLSFYVRNTKGEYNFIPLDEAILMRKCESFFLFREPFHTDVNIRSGKNTSCKFPKHRFSLFPSCLCKNLQIGLSEFIYVHESDKSWNYLVSCETHHANSFSLLIMWRRSYGLLSMRT